MLAGLPQAPARYDPLSSPDAAKARQRVVLDLMARHGYITQAEADRAFEEELQYAAVPYPIEAPHFVAAVWTQLERQFPEALYSGGLEVVTTLDLDWQRAAESAVRRHLDWLNNPPAGIPSHEAHNAAVVALDPHTGQLLAMVGSPDYADEQIDGAVNAALAPRQPGSRSSRSLTPWRSTRRRAPLDPRDDDPRRENAVRHAPPGKLHAANFGLVEHGPVLVREALASSYNIPAVVALDHIGVDGLIRLLTRWDRHAGRPGALRPVADAWWGRGALLDLTRPMARWRTGAAASIQPTSCPCATATATCSMSGSRLPPLTR